MEAHAKVRKRNNLLPLFYYSLHNMYNINVLFLYSNNDFFTNVA